MIEITELPGNAKITIHEGKMDTHGLDEALVEAIKPSRWPDFRSPSVPDEDYWLAEWIIKTLGRGKVTTNKRKKSGPLAGAVY